MGSEQLEVKLGGIYALERIARDSEKDHWSIMEVLTAYVRENAPWPTNARSEARKKLPWVKVKDQETSSQDKGKREEEEGTRIKPDSDIQAILTVLGRRQRKHENPDDHRLDLRETDLRGADLREAHLEGAVLREAHLKEAKLDRAHLEGANLYEAHLEGANLGRAHLEGADLTGAKGLTEWQIRQAIIDKKTKLPDYLKHLEKSAGSKPKKE